jgi:hypothetical protein
MTSIRPCSPDERAAIAGVINAAAEAYRGIIRADRWQSEELDHEIAAGVSFWGYVGLAAPGQTNARTRAGGYRSHPKNTKGQCRAFRPAE